MQDQRAAALQANAAAVASILALLASTQTGKTAGSASADVSLSSGKSTIAAAIESAQASLKAITSGDKKNGSAGRATTPAKKRSKTDAAPLAGRSSRSTGTISLSAARKTYASDSFADT